MQELKTTLHVHQHIFTLCNVFISYSYSFNFALKAWYCNDYLIKHLPIAGDETGDVIEETLDTAVVKTVPDDDGPTTYDNGTGVVEAETTAVGVVEAETTAVGVVEAETTAVGVVKAETTATVSTSVGITTAG